MATVKGNERNREGAALEVSADRPAASRAWTADLSLLAPVVGNECVGQVDTAVDTQDIVANAVNTQIRNGVVATIATADEATSND